MRFVIRPVVILLILYVAQSAFAIEKKWGEVKPEYLTMTVFPDDTSAAAVKLFDVGDLDLDLTSSGIEFLAKRHYQIKILKESGKKYGDIAFSYH